MPSTAAPSGPEWRETGKFFIPRGSSGQSTKIRGPSCTSMSRQCDAGQRPRQVTSTPAAHRHAQFNNNPQLLKTSPHITHTLHLLPWISLGFVCSAKENLCQLLAGAQGETQRAPMRMWTRCHTRTRRTWVPLWRTWRWAGIGTASCSSRCEWTVVCMCARGRVCEGACVRVCVRACVCDRKGGSGWRATACARLFAWACVCARFANLRCTRGFLRRDVRTGEKRVGREELVLDFCGNCRHAFTASHRTAPRPVVRRARVAR